MRKGTAVGIILALAVLVGAAATGAAAAEAGPSAAISSPAFASVITGQQAAVTVLFDAGSAGAVTAAELYVDGEMHDTVAVSPPASAGSCKLTWRCGQFKEGSHKLTARVYDSAGHSSAVDVVVTLKAAPGGAPGLPGKLEVRIAAPAEGQEISGLAQVRVSTDESRVRYVMLLINDVFVALTNMPPFTYALDTTRYLNGSYTLKATAFDVADNPIDSAPVNVIINNPGGRTEMRPEPALPAQSGPEPAATTEPAATAAKLYVDGEMHDTVAVSPPAQVSAASSPTGPAIVTPSGVSPIATPPQPTPAAAEPVASAPAASPPDARATAAAAAGIGVASVGPMNVASQAQLAGTHSAVPAQVAAVIAAPQIQQAPPAPQDRPAPVQVAALPVGAQQPVPPIIAAPASSTAATSIQVAALVPEIAAAPAPAAAPVIATAPPVQVARAPSAPTLVTAATVERGDVILHTVRAGEQLATISARYQVPAREIARFNGLTGGAELAAGHELRIPWASRVMLNGEPVYTDVPPVIEGGISLAPFRAIVEHSGGVAHWIPERRQVRAHAFQREIEVTIGSRVAVVDASQCTLETEARLLRGRALVPLGLFRDALGLKVTFEPTSGRIYLAAQ